MSKKDILLIGGGGHCKSVIDVIEVENKFNIVGIIDKIDKVGEKVLGYQIIGSDEDIPKLKKVVQFAFISAGQIRDYSFRSNMFIKLRKLNFNIPVIISPISYVSKHSTVGEGTIIMHNALINSNVKVGENCIINSKALVEHDVIVGNNCHISTGSVLNGGVIVKDNSFIGSNTSTKQGIEIEGFNKAGIFIK